LARPSPTFSGFCGRGFGSAAGVPSARPALRTSGRCRRPALVAATSVGAGTGDDRVCRVGSHGRARVGTAWSDCGADGCRAARGNCRARTAPGARDGHPQRMARAWPVRCRRSVAPDGLLLRVTGSARRVRKPARTRTLARSGLRLRTTHAARHPAPRRRCIHARLLWRGAVTSPPC